MGKATEPLLLNLGCGSNKWGTHVNVDAYGDCDVRHDLNSFPYPWDDDSVDGIDIYHVLEHIPDWWGAFCECARILKPGGYLHVRVPDETSHTALTYRDHLHVFSLQSFHGIQGYTHGTSAWAKEERDKVPLKVESYHRVPFPEYQWMFRWPFTWLGTFCAKHMRNFIWEQRIVFKKVGK